MMETLAHVVVAGTGSSCDLGVHLDGSYARDGTGGHGKTVFKSFIRAL